MSHQFYFSLFHFLNIFIWIVHINDVIHITSKERHIPHLAHWARYDVNCSEKVIREDDQIRRILILNHYLGVLRL